MQLALEFSNRTKTRSRLQFASRHGTYPVRLLEKLSITAVYIFSLVRSISNFLFYCQRAYQSRNSSTASSKHNRTAISHSPVECTIQTLAETLYVGVHYQRGFEHSQRHVSGHPIQHHRFKRSKRSIRFGTMTENIQEREPLEVPAEKTLVRVWSVTVARLP